MSASNSKIFTIICFLIIWTSCSSGKQILVKKSDLNEFELLGDAIAGRDADQLLGFTSHNNKVIVKNAWRGLAVTEVDDFYKKADASLKNGIMMACFALSFQEFGQPVLKQITGDFASGNIAPENGCLVFIQHGNIEILNVLMSEKKMIINHNSCSRAVGAILTREEAEESLIDEIIEIIVNSNDEITIRNLLYGFRRSSLNRPAETSAAHQRLIEFLASRANQSSTIVDEYLVVITGKSGFNTLMENRLAELENNMQLAVVTAAQLRFFRPDELNTDYVEWLLSHPNPHVAIQTLETLKQIENSEQDWISRFDIKLSESGKNAEIALSYIELLSQNGMNLSAYKHLISSIEQENDYLKPRVYELYKKVLSAEDYFEKLFADIEKGGITGRFAIIEMGEFMKNHQQQFFHDQFIEFVDSVLEKGDRMMISAMAQYLGEMLNELYPGQFEPMPAPEPVSVQKPDWERLYELGENPLWVLETKKGFVKIRLKTFSAPFTVSAIDSLTRSGAYAGVPFHRVVRNFVIQGGDYDRRDGSGNAGFRLPTEPPFDTFRRGSVGMASSGTDTEGSQFFITQTWTPHLDGLYTIFGEVVEGMDVVETIQIGDQILKAWIE